MLNINIRRVYGHTSNSEWIFLKLTYMLPEQSYRTNAICFIWHIRFHIRAKKETLRLCYTNIQFSYTSIVCIQGYAQHYASFIMVYWHICLPVLLLVPLDVTSGVAAVVGGVYTTLLCFPASAIITVSSAGQVMRSAVSVSVGRQHMPSGKNRNVSSTDAA